MCFTLAETFLKWIFISFSFSKGFSFVSLGASTDNGATVSVDAGLVVVDETRSESMPLLLLLLLVLVLLLIFVDDCLEISV